MIAVRLDAETEQRLKSLAIQTNRTKSFYIKQALKEYLEDLEDIYISEERLEESRKEELISFEEIKKNLAYE